MTPRVVVSVVVVGVVTTGASASFIMSVSHTHKVRRLCYIYIYLYEWVVRDVLGVRTEIHMIFLRWRLVVRRDGPVLILLKI